MPKWGHNGALKEIWVKASVRNKTNDLGMPPAPGHGFLDKETATYERKYTQPSSSLRGMAPSHGAKLCLICSFRHRRLFVTLGQGTLKDRWAQDARVP